jgi:hypothetical protein
MELSFIKHATRKEEGMATIFIRKVILSLLKKEVVNVVDLGYLGIEKDFPEQLSSTPHRKKRNFAVFVQRAKRIQSRLCSKENSDRAHHLSIKKI